MLDLSIAIRSCTRFSCSLLFALTIATTPLHSSFWEKESKPLRHFEQDWIRRYFGCLDENTEIGEVVDFLISVKESWIARGYDCPCVFELAIRLKKELEDEGIEVDEEAIQEIYEEIYRREQVIVPASFRLTSIESKSIFELCKRKHNSRKKDKGDKEFKMKSKGVFGFLKALGGGLICVLPFPGAQAIGGALIVDGIKDMIEDAREIGDENEHLQKLDELRRQERQMLENDDPKKPQKDLY